VNEELERLIEHAQKKGLPVESVESVYLKGDEAIKEHDKRNGYDLALGSNGVMSSQQENTNDVAGSDIDAIKDFSALSLVWSRAKRSESS
jgi:hypothetical protein